jgi:hypothetical protein
LLAHLGSDRITRVTFMRHVFPDEDGWQLVLFDRDGDALVARAIPDTDGPEQKILGASARADTLGGIFSPASPTLPDVSTLAAAARPAQPTPEIENGFAQAIEAQNPLRHTSEDTDCGSCHLAEGARRAGEAYGFVATGEFASGRSLGYVRESKAITNFHAFGYLGTTTSVMQRTANESAVVADRMHAALTAR